MTEYQFNKIMDEVIASFYMEGIIIPCEVIQQIKERYVKTTSKILVKGGKYDIKNSK